MDTVAVSPRLISVGETAIRYMLLPRHPRGVEPRYGEPLGDGDGSAEASTASGEPTTSRVGTNRSRSTGNTGTARPRPRLNSVLKAHPSAAPCEGILAPTPSWRHRQPSTRAPDFLSATGFAPTSPSEERSPCALCAAAVPRTC